MFIQNTETILLLHYYRSKRTVLLRLTRNILCTQKLKYSVKVNTFISVGILFACIYLNRVYVYCTLQCISIHYFFTPNKRGRNSSRRHFEVFSYFYQKKKASIVHANYFLSLLSWKNKKNNINLFSVPSRKHTYVILTPLNPTFV